MEFGCFESLVTEVIGLHTAESGICSCPSLFLRDDGNNERMRIRVEVIWKDVHRETAGFQMTFIFFILLYIIWFEVNKHVLFFRKSPKSVLFLEKKTKEAKTFV